MTSHRRAPLENAIRPVRIRPLPWEFGAFGTPVFTLSSASSQSQNTTTNGTMEAGTSARRGHETSLHITTAYFAFSRAIPGGGRDGT